MAKAKPNYRQVQSAVLATSKANYTNSWRTILEFFDNSITPSREALRYARMDAEVKAATTLLWDAVFGDGLKIVPAVSEDDAEYAEAERIAEFFKKEVIANPDIPFIHYLRDFSDDAFHEGTSFAKVNAKYKDIEGESVPKLVLDSFNQYELDEISVIEDEEGNAVAVYTSDISRIYRNNYNKGIPIEAFVITTHQRRKKGVYGISQLVACVSHICSKVKTFLKWDTFLNTCAMPKTAVIVEILQGQEFIRDANGQTIADPTDPTGFKTTVGAINDSISDLGNGSAVTLTHGTNHPTEIQQLEVKGDGKAFEMRLTFEDVAIRKAILLQTRATGEGTDGSGGTNATSDSQSQILNKRIIELRLNVEETVRRSIFKTFTALNFGEDKIHLTPKADLGQIADDQWATKMGVFISGGWKADPVQFPAIDEYAGLEKRPDDWQEQDLAKRVEETRQMTKATAQPEQKQVVTK